MDRQGNLSPETENTQDPLNPWSDSISSRRVIIQELLSCSLPCEAGWRSIDAGQEEVDGNVQVKN